MNDKYNTTLDQFQLRDEYESLIKPVTDCVNDLNHSCNIHLDVGQYFFSDYDTIDTAIIPFIHIVISAPETNLLEQTVEQAINENSTYRLFDKITVGCPYLAVSISHNNLLILKMPVQE